MDIRMIKEADWKGLAVIALVILLVLAVIVGWYRGQHEQVVPKTTYGQAPEIKRAENIARVDIPVKKVMVLEKEAASKKLDLPPEVKDDPDKEITATAVIPPYEGQTNVLAVFDRSTGGSTIMAKQLALPFMDFENNGELGIRYGLSMKNSQEADLYGRWDFFRIARIHMGLYGETNSTGDAKAQLQAAYKW